MIRYCVCDWPCASDLETCGHYLCELHARGFGELVLADEGAGGFRHYLHGEPVSCGSGLLLQPHPEYAPAGTHAARVRYEAVLSGLRPGEQPVHVFYASVAGFEAVIRGYPGQLLRWPPRSR